MVLTLAQFQPLFSQYKELVRGEMTNVEWSEDGLLSYKTRTDEGLRSYVVDPMAKSKSDVTDDKKDDKKEEEKQSSEKPKSPLQIFDNNLYAKCDDGEKIQLSFDGTTLNHYTNRFTYSPDSSYVVVMKRREVAEREVTFVESSPKSQLQPLLHTNTYVKPGDELTIDLPMLFDLKRNKKVEVDLTPYLNQFHIRQIRWDEDGERFTFEFNERGHQRYQIVEVNASSGELRTLVDEQSDTFIFYNKVWRKHLDSRDEILWLSERDGWRHIYLFDTRKEDRVKRQITKGEWVVRDVLYVDDESETIYFTASGRNKGENPYYTHLYKVGFNGANLTELTPESGNHTITLSPDKSLFVDIYSTPEVEPVAQIRELKTGAITMALERGDASKAEEAGWMRPVVFSAKGRDGLTDIWGNIYFPKGYDPSKKYPVLEYIYAGPHDSHVINSFHVDTYYRAKPSERGYIVVQIDGMGTYNRSKAFHDLCFKNLKDAGFPDRIKWIEAAAEKYSSFDLSRVGVYGASAGGQSSTGALLFFNDFYKAAVSSCGCHDNRMDKIWWNEQWMGYPVGPEYGESSNVDNAHLLEGRLMLIVGEMDTNVDPASTMQVVSALVDAKKYFELLVLPSQGHTFGGDYGMDRAIDFFDRNLKNSPLEFVPTPKKDESKTK